MADGFYTHDDDELGSFGGYGSDGAESCDDATGSNSGFASQSAANDRIEGAGGYGTGHVRRFRMFRPFSRSFCSGDYGRMG